ncbi:MULTISPECIES: autotransporter domain-containing protein [Stenotrophomonas]|uniref:Autotransporter outer membrane beta-barrel domain-containing protein n=1 Tax=Stenotrophomonas maltophilia TaxID=40324 RepID=A0A2J0UD24_STEMA|nr:MULTISPECIES: autotransporter domain-containing protein [Stenotrophomonas]PJL31339.1 autotransporter outer membrane beta-barrel domain-containing protein [Stenotrophomonas maltophilia]HDS1147073.1 autotransporter domain-containing protein [Stenotrophomonas maltophilia]HDS1161615.1 autotransporter domain-containing protein [Stenotrophomonas maltophilia]
MFRAVPPVLRLRRLTIALLQVLAAGPLLALGAPPAAAAGSCSSTSPTSNTAVTCTGDGVPAVVAATGSSNVSISLDATANGSFVLGSDPTPYSVDSASTISNSGNLSMSGNGSGVANRGAVLLGANNGNTITNTNSGVISTTGAYNDGIAANGNGNVLVNNGSITTTGNNSYGMTAAWGQSNSGAANNTIINTGTVTTSGNNARAASLLGGNGTIDNSGTLTSNGRNAPAVYMQGNNNTLTNSGTVLATGATNSSGSADAVVSNTLGRSFTATITNLAGGRIISSNGIGVRSTNGATTITNAGRIEGGSGTAIQGGNGDVTLVLQTGSEIVGVANGGNGTNTVTLQGTGTASNAFNGFQSLTMAGDAWAWAGTGTFDTARVQSGTLDLTGTLGTSTASVVATVDAGATLQANAGNLPLSVTDNGLVRFKQDSAGTYTGTLSGSGAVEKTGAGTLTLAPASGNTYAGGTTLSQGVLSVAADAALGAASGPLAFNGGTLQLGGAFDLDAARALSITANNGAIDTQGFNSTLAQGISGVGALTKLGSGTLTLNGASSHAGGTNIAAGTLVLGSSSSAAASLGGGGPVQVAAGATLGGYGSVTGNVSNTGTIAVANAAPGLAAGNSGTFRINGNLANAGLLQLGGTGVGNTLTVAGNYVGQDATIALNAYLAGDGAPSDRLVVDGGAASGRSSLKVTNVGGPGAASMVDGVMVVQALNGATSTAGAFTLYAPVSAGAHQYFLFKGGVSPGTGQNWYMRSNQVVEPTPDTPTPPTPSDDSGLPGTGTPPPTPDAEPAEPDDDGTVPLYRVETALYSGVLPLLREASRASLGTFHERQGEQRLLYSQGALRTAWGRLVGQSSEIHWKGNARSGFDGEVMGVQAGLDVWAMDSGNHRNQVGVFVGRTRAQGRSTGLALGWDNVDVGQSRLDDKHVGLYWTLTGSEGGYLDAVALQSRYDGRVRSSRGLGFGIRGDGTTLSLEAGKPLLRFGQSVWWLEPQAQVIWQRLSLDDRRDLVSTERFDSDNAWTARIGLRLAGDYQLADNGWQPYFKLNYWHGRSGEDRVRFDDEAIINTQRSRALEAGVGVVGRFNRTISAYAVADYARELGGDRNEKRRIIEGNIGLRADW